MKTAKQWVEESNWSDELKELFWERVKQSERYIDDSYYLFGIVIRAFDWETTPEGHDFWHDVAYGTRTDIDRPENTDREYETLMRKMLEGLKGKEVGIGNDAFLRGYNTAIREMNEKIDEAIKKLEI